MAPLGLVCTSPRATLVAMVVILTLACRSFSYRADNKMVRPKGRPWLKRFESRHFRKKTRFCLFFRKFSFAWFLSVILHDRLPVLRFSHDFHVVGRVWKELPQARERCEGEIRGHSGFRGGREPLAGAKAWFQSHSFS